ncbi:ABC transporter permease [Halobacteriales archaeon SW_7_65_23]|nr:MAG: ABC transporter permease [Halobacteriales archaeon SW_7_65_23]
MTRSGRVYATTRAGWYSFLRRRTAVFFTFFFPAIIVVIFGALVQTQPTDGGLFTEPTGWYVAGYIGVVVLFTPLSRVSSEVSRHREGGQFEKLTTTPLQRWEWLLSQTVVNTAIIGLASLLLLALLLGATGADLALSAETLLVVPFVVLGVATFCAVGSILGSVVSSQDGVIAASNGLAIPLLFLSEAFVPADLLPEWLPLGLSPLTYFTRGVRAVTFDSASATSSVLGVSAPAPYADLGVLAALTVVLFVLASVALPRAD